MRVIADLQIHSRFSRAVSQQMTPPVISQWAKKKGIELVATGDWTHPIWYRELRANLIEAGEGVYKQKDAEEGSPLFLLSTEISSIYSQGGKGRRIHTLVFAPNFETVEKINKELTLRGANLLSDGRPIIGLTAKNVAEVALGVDSRCLIIPAHAWTPYFSVFGSISGFDSIDECFEELAPEIYAIETGLSSDPAMNWRIAELSSRRIVSFSDAHSPAKMGREATAFELSEISYENIRKAIVGKWEDRGEKLDIEVGSEKSKLSLRSEATRVSSLQPHISFTIEFYPEEGKYHYTGHRNCKVVYSPNDARKLGTACPVCGKPLTVGVMSRVEELASVEIETKGEIDKFGVRWIKDKEEKRTPYVMMVPLLEILSEALESGVASQKVQASYEQMINSLGNEFKILLETDIHEISAIAGPRISEAISLVRNGDIAIEPGYDGVFGKVKIWKENKEEEPQTLDQGSLF
ncbi:endonuclease Q family protein [Patescibacteria group bacterium]|nr:endonuclease Q family protein [Patescibacteria group bacterium]